MTTRFGKKMKVAAALTGLLVASCGLSGCGKGRKDAPRLSLSRISALPPAQSGTFTDVYQNTLSTACIECHVPGGTGMAAGARLDFTDRGMAYRTLVGGSVSGGSSVGTCGGLQLVQPGVPQESYLAAVLFAEYNATGFGGVPECKPYSAHLQDQHLSDSERASLVAWIRNGARND